MQKYRFTKEQAAEIASARKATANKAMASHLEILRLRSIGTPVKEICRQTGVCSGVVYKLAHDYHTVGLNKMLEGLQPYYTSVDKYTFTQEQIAEISDAYRGAADGEVRRRLEALYLCAQGESAGSAAHRLNVSSQTVQRTVFRYKENGLDTVIERAIAYGRKRKTEFAPTPAQISELRRMLETAASERVARRFRALLLCGEGKTVREAATETGVNPASVRSFISEYQKRGASSLCITRKNRHKRPFAAPKYKFTIQQKAEIESALKTITDGRAARKLEALWLRTEGRNLPEIAEATGIHTATLTQIIRKYQENGLAAITQDLRKARRPPEHTWRYMAYDEEARILKRLSPRKRKRRPVPKSAIKAAFEEELGHSVSDCWICSLLRRHRWSPVSSWMPPEK